MMSKDYDKISNLMKKLNFEISSAKGNAFELTLTREDKGIEEIIIFEISSVYINADLNLKDLETIIECQKILKEMINNAKN